MEKLKTLLPREYSQNFTGSAKNKIQINKIQRIKGQTKMINE
jgi:hypothetical protein